MAAGHSQPTRDRQKNAARLRKRRVMVEAAGQLIHLFRDGPDYAFILQRRMRGVLSVLACGRILVPARCASRAVSQPMSLYRAGLRLALFLPLGIAIPPAAYPPCGAGFADVSPVVTLPLRAEATITNRTRVRKRYTGRTTCLASSLCFRSGATDGQATPMPVT